MANRNQHDHALTLEKARALLRSGECAANWAALARALNYNVDTLKQSFYREFKIANPTQILGKLGDQPPKKYGLSQEKSTNEWEITDNGPLVRTLEQLLKVCKVDLNIWTVRDYLVNQWQANAGAGQVIPLYQVKAWLVRKQLEQITPVIAPVHVEMPKVRVSKPERRKMRRALIVADPQVGFRRRMHTSELIPFHDRRVLDIALQIVHADQMDDILFIGDCLDLSMWSTKFTAEPEFYWTTQPALIEWAWWLSLFRQANPSAVIKQHEGNHDKRMPDFVVSNMKEAYGLKAVDELQLPPAVSVPKLLALHELNVEYVKNYPDDGWWLNRNVVVKHGNVARGGEGDTAKAVINKSTYTTIFGHIHRRESVTRRIQTRDGHALQTAFCPGCACHIDGRVPGASMDDNWQNGLAIIEYTDDMEHIIPIEVDRGLAIYNGEVYKGSDRDKEINKMLMEKLGGM